ncbi:acetyltransferase (plasmid) [Devosia neptuniae]|jgi:sugar O-acyltransferase (sialic acid O-acetyltransferase NeuD family)|uniref:Acetyltransferase n=1 Tax=Devosia neptuniae TaxID=191302 RepID=A0ABY6C6B1_9HYPH|nr:acetyltransferase [Devosia neptuniae]UXN67834.1 acetyltransferase [Devosia neptuniae]
MRPNQPRTVEKTKNLVIVGAGEFAMIAYEYFTHDSEYRVVGFAVERAYLTATELLGLPVVAFEDVTETFPIAGNHVFVAVPASDLNATRTRLYQEAKEKGYSIATYVSSWAFVWHNCKIGENCFIFEDNTLQPFTEVGNNVIMWSGNHLGHRSVIEDNCFVSSHVVISGYCRIGNSTFVGVNSTLNDHVTIPEYCIIASGTLITKTLPNPAKIYRGAPATEVPRLDARKTKL